MTGKGTYQIDQQIQVSKKYDSINFSILFWSGVVNKYVFVHQKFKIRTFTFNTRFSTTQYSFRILYLTTQIQMDIVYRKTDFKSKFIRFLMYKY